MRIASAYHRFHAPAVAKGPVITVGKATAIQIAAQYMVFQSGDKRDLSDIEVAVMPMHAEEVAFKLAAKPVAHFGLHQIHI